MTNERLRILLRPADSGLQRGAASEPFIVS